MKYSSSFLQKIFDKFRPLQIFDDGESDQDLRMMLAKAMKEIDPAFDWICEVYSETGSVIYSTYVIMGGSYKGVMQYYRRTFSLSADGKSVTVNDDAVEVRPKQVWETVDGEEENTEEIVAASSSESCSCHSKGPEPKSTESAKSAESETHPIGENQVENNETKEPVVAASNQSQPQPPSQPLSLTEEQALAACPSLKPLVDGFRAQQEGRKKQLVSVLSQRQTKISKEELEKRDMKQLEEYAALLGIEEGERAETESTPPTDYSLLGAAAENTTKKDGNWRKLPDPWNLEKKKA